MKTSKAKVFRRGSSQLVSLPKGFGFDTDTVTVERKGKSLVLAPVEASADAADGWPAGWLQSFAGVPSDFKRPPQGPITKRQKLR